MSRNEEIADRFQKWLARFTPPQGIKGNPQAMQAEAESLLRHLLKRAPAMGYATWLDEVFDRCHQTMKTRAWPTMHELGAACANSYKARPTESVTPKDEYEINAARIKAGEPVGDGWVYGKFAVELIDRGLIAETELTNYRSGLFFAMKDAWGQDVAQQKEQDLRRRHAWALELKRIAA